MFRWKAAKAADCAAALWRAPDLKDTCSVCPRQRDDNSTNSSRSYLVSCTGGSAEGYFSVGNPFDPFMIFKLIWNAADKESHCISLPVSHSRGNNAGLCGCCVRLSQLCHIVCTLVA